MKASEVKKLLKQRIENFDKILDVSEVGYISSLADGIARATGLDNVQAGEMVEFSNGSIGVALNLEEDNVGIVIFGESNDIKEGDEVKRTQDFPSANR